MAIMHIRFVTESTLAFLHSLLIIELMARRNQSVPKYPPCRTPGLNAAEITSNRRIFWQHRDSRKKDAPLMLAAKSRKSQYDAIGLYVQVYESKLAAAILNN